MSIEAAREAGVADCVVVVGDRPEADARARGRRRRRALRRAAAAARHRPRRRSARAKPQATPDFVLIMNGDVPLVLPETLAAPHGRRRHDDGAPDLALLTA